MSKLDKPLEFIGSSREDLSAFPVAVKSLMGFALRVAQKGDKHADAKPLKGFGGAGVVEIVSDHDGDAFRAVYTVRLRGIVYVLHAFQKKARRGIKTPKNEIEKIRSRLKIAEKLHQTMEGKDEDETAEHKEQRKRIRGFGSAKRR